MFAAPTFIHRLAAGVRAFALLEDPELEARMAREAAILRAHHRRPPAQKRIQHSRRPGAIRHTTQPCRAPVPH
jgi:hypothetical protein